MPQFPTISTIATVHDTEGFRLWFGERGVVDPAGAPLVVYHGTQTPENLHTFTPGGGYGARQSGDAYGVAAYFTTSPSEAGFYAKDNGAILPVYVRGEILDLDGAITPAQAQRLTDLAAQLLLPSDRARFENGRDRLVFDDVQDAREFFANQRKNWEAFGDGMDRARPEALAEGGRFVVEYTNYDAPVSIRNGNDAATLFKAVGWDNLAAAGFDGLKMLRSDGNSWLVMHRPEGNVKSALGNCGAFNPLDPDITDRRAAVERVRDFLAGLQRKMAPHA